MSIPKYIYIDDENGPSEVSTLHGFNDSKLVEVERFPLSEYREFGALKNALIDRSKSKRFDGIIIDLRLDGSGEDRTEFNATSIAQEIRSVAARGEMPTFPIVLCSTDEKIRHTYNSDKTSHDLFDYKISKSNSSPNWLKLATKLSSLAKGYLWLNEEQRELNSIFDITDLSQIDTRIIEKTEVFSAIYDYAHFVIKDFFHQTNPLINEKVLAARLGIDLKNTPSSSWQKLIDTLFGKAAYTGLFSDGWKRWWADIVSDVFYEVSNEKLAFLKAEERVSILKKVSGIENLIAATPLKFCNSSEFWTICEGFKVPLDPLEGFKISTSTDLKVWQESKYISLLAVLEREGFSDRGIKPHPSELEKIEYTKELLGIS
jgi:hypothetical protein